MTRRLLNLLTLLSVVALACLLYVYAWAVAEGMGMGEYSRQRQVKDATYWMNCNASGALRFGIGRKIAGGNRVDPDTGRERGVFAGIRVGNSDRPDLTERSVRVQHHWVTVPLVYLLLPAAVLPSIRLAQWRRRAAAARRAGRCR